VVGARPPSMGEGGLWETETPLMMTRARSLEWAQKGEVLQDKG